MPKEVGLSVYPELHFKELFATKSWRSGPLNLSLALSYRVESLKI